MISTKTILVCLAALLALVVLASANQAVKPVKLNKQANYALQKKLLVLKPGGKHWVANKKTFKQLYLPLAKVQGFSANKKLLFANKPVAFYGPKNKVFKAQWLKPKMRSLKPSAAPTFRAQQSTTVMTRSLQAPSGTPGPITSTLVPTEAMVALQSSSVAPATTVLPAPQDS